MLSDVIHRLRAVFKRTTIEQELDQERRFHIDRQVETVLLAALGGLSGPWVQRSQPER